MPKDRKKLRKDVAETAYRTMLEATGQAEKTIPPGEGEPDPEAAERGREGGKKGGPARAAKLTPEERSEIAKRAAEKRWHGSGGDSKP